MVAVSRGMKSLSLLDVEVANVPYGALAAGAAAAVAVGAGLLLLSHGRRRASSEADRPAASHGWVRPATEMENFWGSMHADGTLHTVCAVALGGSVMDPETARRAMRCVAARHPILRSVFEVPEGHSVAWVRDLGDAWQPELQVVEGGTTLEEAACEAWNSVQFPAPGVDKQTPTWRARILTPSGGLVFVLHHGVVDGTSRFRVVKDFMRFAGGADAEADTNAIREVPAELSPEQAASLARLLDVDPLKKFLWNASAFWKQAFGRLPWQFPSGMMADDCEGGGGQSRYIAVPLSEAETASLIKASRAARTTVHAAVCAASLLAIADVAGIQEGDPPVVMPSGHLASLRGRVDPVISDHQLGGFITAYLIEAEVTAGSSEKVWQLARTLKSKLTAKAEEPAYFLATLPANMVGAQLRGTVFADTSEYFKRGRRGLINFSNLGVQDFEDDYGGYSVEGVYSGTAEQRGGPVCCFNFATVRRRLHGTLMYYTNVWTTDTATSFVEAFRRRLKAMLV